MSAKSKALESVKGSKPMTRVCKDCGAKSMSKVCNECREESSEK